MFGFLYVKKVINYMQAGMHLEKAQRTGLFLI